MAPTRLDGGCAIVKARVQLAHLVVGHNQENLGKHTSETHQLDTVGHKQALNSSTETKVRANTKISTRADVSFSTLQALRRCQSLLAQTNHARRTSLTKYRVLVHWQRAASLKRRCEIKCIRHILRRGLKEQDRTFASWRWYVQARKSKRATLRQLVLIWLRRKLRHCFSVWVLYVLYSSSPLGMAARSSRLDSSDNSRVLLCHQRNATICQHRAGLYRCLRNALGVNSRECSPRSLKSNRQKADEQVHDTRTTSENSENRMKELAEKKILLRRCLVASFSAWRLRARCNRASRGLLFRQEAYVKRRRLYAAILAWHTKLKMSRRAERIVRQRRAHHNRSLKVTVLHDFRDRVAFLHASRHRLAIAYRRVLARSLIQWTRSVASRRDAQYMLRSATRRLLRVPLAASLRKWRIAVRMRCAVRRFACRRTTLHARRSVHIAWSRWRKVVTDLHFALYMHVQRRVRRIMRAWQIVRNNRHGNFHLLNCMMRRMARFRCRNILRRWNRHTAKHNLRIRRRLDTLATWCRNRIAKTLTTYFSCWSDVCLQTTMNRMAYTTALIWQKICSRRYRAALDAWKAATAMCKARRTAARKLYSARIWLGRLDVFSRWRATICSKMRLRRRFGVLQFRLRRRVCRAIIYKWMTFAKSTMYFRTFLLQRTQRGLFRAWRCAVEQARELDRQLLHAIRRLRSMQMRFTLFAWLRVHNLVQRNAQIVDRRVAKIIAEAQRSSFMHWFGITRISQIKVNAESSRQRVYHHCNQIIRKFAQRRKAHVVSEWRIVVMSMRRARAIAGRRLKAAMHASLAASFKSWEELALRRRLILRALMVASHNQLRWQRSALARMFRAWHYALAGRDETARRCAMRMRRFAVSRAYLAWHSHATWRRATRHRLALAYRRVVARALNQWALRVSSRRNALRVLRSATRRVFRVSLAVSLRKWRFTVRSERVTRRARAIAGRRLKAAMHASLAASFKSWEELAHRRRLILRALMVASHNQLRWQRSALARMFRAWHYALAGRDETARRCAMRMRRFAVSRAYLAWHSHATWRRATRRRLALAYRRVVARALNQWALRVSSRRNALRVLRSATRRVFRVSLAVSLRKWRFTVRSERVTRRARAIAGRRLKAAMHASLAASFKSWEELALRRRLILRALMVASHNQLRWQRSALARMFRAWHYALAGRDETARRCAMRMRRFAVSRAYLAWHSHATWRRATRRRLALAYRRVVARALNQWALRVSSRRNALRVLRSATRRVFRVSLAVSLRKWRFTVRSERVTRRARAIAGRRLKAAMHASLAASFKSWEELALRRRLILRALMVASHNQLRWQRSALARIFRAWHYALAGRDETARRCAMRMRRFAVSRAYLAWHSHATWRRATRRRLALAYRRVVARALNQWALCVAKQRVESFHDMSMRRFVANRTWSFFRSAFKVWCDEVWSTRLLRARMNRYASRARCRYSIVVLRLWRSSVATSRISRLRHSLNKSYDDETVAFAFEHWRLFVAQQMRGRYGLALKWIADTAAVEPALAKRSRALRKPKHSSNQHEPTTNGDPAFSLTPKPRWLPPGVALHDLQGALLTPLSGMMASKSYAAASPAAGAARRRKSLKMSPVAPALPTTDPKHGMERRTKTQEHAQSVTPARLVGYSPVSVLNICSEDSPSPVQASRSSSTFVDDNAARLKQSAGKRHILERIEAGAATLLAMHRNDTANSGPWETGRSFEVGEFFPMTKMGDE